MRVVIVAVVLILILVFLYTWLRFRKNIYVHANLDQELMQKYPLKYQPISFETQDNQTISAWYIPVKNPKAFIILVHGFTDKNGGKALMLPHADYLQKAGYATLLVDLRSAGASSGDKVYLGTKEWMEVEESYDYLAALPESRNKKIGFMGISMGAVTSIVTVGKTGKGDFLIASVPFSSYDEQFSYELRKAGLPANVFLPFLQLSAFIEYGKYWEYNPSQLIQNIKSPLFIITGKRDMDIDYHQGKNLFMKANSPKLYWEADAQHDVFDELPDEFTRKVLSFLKSINP